MFHLALYQPQIPPNTGNLIRLSANTGFCLHLIHPLGFDFSDKHLKRAGCDYHERALVSQHADYGAFSQAMSGRRIIAIETSGKINYSDIAYQAGDVLLFGGEVHGLPHEVLTSVDLVARIPMLPSNRSLNLSNAAAIVYYEAWRQHLFSC